MTQAISLTAGENDLIRRCLVYVRDDLLAPRNAGESPVLFLSVDATSYILNDLIDRLCLLDVRARREQVALEAAADDRLPY